MAKRGGRVKARALRSVDTRSAPDLPGSDDITRAINSCRRALDQGDRVTAARWLDRACRLKATDPVSRLRLILLCLQLFDARTELLLNELIIEYPDFREPRIGLASLLLRRGRDTEAGKILALLLARTSPGPDAGFRQIADSIAAGCAAPGWIGASNSGRVTLGHPGAFEGRLALRLDGQAVALDWTAEPYASVLIADLPAGWTKSRVLTASLNGRALLGSPISLADLRRVEGIVEVAASGLIEGWAWLPGDPEATPELRVFRESRPDAVGTVIASDEFILLPPGSGAIRPRGFKFDPLTLGGGGAVHIIGPDDRPLPGSPCYPADEFLFARSGAAAIARLYPASPSRTPSGKRNDAIRWVQVPVGSEQNSRGTARQTEDDAKPRARQRDRSCL